MIITIDIQRLQQARLTKGYSQRELSRVAGLSTIVINSLERNKSIPRPSTLKRICDVLDITVADVCKIES